MVAWGYFIFDLTFAVKVVLVMLSSDGTVPADLHLSYFFTHRYD